MNQLILLHSCDYLQKTIKINVATDKMNCDTEQTMKLD